MGLFKDLYGKTDEALTTIKRPLIERKVKRGFDSAIDSLEAELIDLEDKIATKRQEVANGDISEIRGLSLLQIEIEETRLQIGSLQTEKKSFFD